MWMLPAAHRPREQLEFGDAHVGYLLGIGIHVEVEVTEGRGHDADPPVAGSEHLSKIPVVGEPQQIL